ncbi:hypothetical protein P43SY_005281 [Pythium insidiosum]|uniref:Rhodanese domain-containing protein n=1 Tax=Pythium insidiosum TaxID=114742 RepID=A0AAD5M0R5_PYTIN|nr:hypothetical protein P43SY_005281 [Pythium insidiosum]
MASSSDFDDIFGDLKEDQQFAASLPHDHDAASIFGDGGGKPTLEKPGAADQDEFLSWLDEGPPASVTSSVPVDPVKSTAQPTPPATTAALPARTTGSSSSLAGMQTIDLGDDDDPLDSPMTSPSSTAAVGPLPPAIAVSVPTSTPPSAAPAVAVSPPPPASSTPPPAPAEPTTISLDDDDDDDLEKIIAQANAAAAAKTTGSRDSSHSSLQIKSQRTDSLRQQVDVAALTKQFFDSGAMPSSSARIPLWHHAVGADKAADMASVTMYAVQTTPLDLGNQAALRKDVEDMCSVIFCSAVHTETMSATSHAQDTVDATRLLFLDNAEIVVTYLCKKVGLTEYPSGLAFTFAPALAASGNDPMRLDLVATLSLAAKRVLPSLAKSVPVAQIAAGRRTLLKLLLLYHAPSVAFHLDQHFHTWNSAAIPDAWLASVFEDQTQRDGAYLDALVRVWDCCLLLSGPEAPLATSSSAWRMASMCFLTVFLILKAEKKLMRMDGDQLKHCMTKALVDALKDRSEPLVLGVRRLLDATPPSFAAKLQDAGIVSVCPAPSTGSASDGSTPKDNKFSLLSASTNGVKQVGSLVVDLPTKLITTMVVPFKAAASAAQATNGPSAAQQAEELYHQLTQEAMTSASVCMPLSASDVIPRVFRSFQAPPSEPSGIRYFVIDCRATEETQQGQVPTAFHFDPDAVADPAVLDTVLATLNPLKGTVHMCVMGHGHGHLADELRQHAAPTTASGELPFYLQPEFLEAFARDISRVNAALLFLAKRGFPHVSVLDGGYVATHEELMLHVSEGFSVADLIDHDAPRCSLCQHHRGLLLSPTAAAVATAAAAPAQAGSPSSDAAAAAKPPTQSAGPKTSGAGTGELDAKALFDARSGPSNPVLSGMAGAFKMGGKAMLGTGVALKDGQKWLMKKTGAGSSSSPASPDPTGNASPSSGKSSGLGFAKIKSSLSHLGTESLDMLKKAEQAAAKGMFSPSAAANVKAASGGNRTNSNSSSSSSPASPLTGGKPPSRDASFQKTDEEVFTIDDDEEEEQDDFVGGSASGGSRTSSSSSMTGSHRSESFSGGRPDGVGSTVVLHTVEKGGIQELKKGMRVSRTQMLPFVDSPFFSAYKKKKAAPAPGAPPTSGRASMLPRRLVLAENHVVVLKAERNMEDVYHVKSCHSLTHMARMTCLKKNALMVTVYYKWQAASGQVVEKRNAYEVQQRDEFIKVIKAAMEKM